MPAISRWIVFYMLLLSSFTAFGWNALGHMVVAEIAYQQLNPSAKDQLNYLVSQFNQEYPFAKSYLDLAYWPDTLRSQKIHLYTHWHYIDQPISFDNTPNNQRDNTDNAIWALERIHLIVENHRANSFERARFLAFFIHIVADLHQPLHTVSLFSQKHTQGDHGGNLYMIKYDHRTMNLHQLWDQGVGLFKGRNSKRHAHQMANLLIAKYPKHFFGNQVRELNPCQWLKEGADHAKKYVYNISESGSVDTVYEEKGQELVEQSATLGGYRLGALLNQLLS